MRRVRKSSRKAVLGVVAMLWACGDGSTAPEPPPNRAPEASGSISPRTVTAGQTTTVNVGSAFRDPDGNPLTYAATTSDPGIAAASVSGTIVTISGVAPGTAAITVTATDPRGLSAAQSFTVTVERPNRAPVHVDGWPDGSVAADTVSLGIRVSVPGSELFTDPDGDPLRFEASSADTTIVRAGTESGGANIVLEAVGVGTTRVTVRAIDPGGLSITLYSETTVLQPNRAPEATGSIDARTVRPGEEFRLDVAPFFTDPDGDSLTYEVSHTGSAVGRTDWSGSTLTVVAGTQGNATVTVTACDAEPLCADQSFDVTVRNRAPEVAAAFGDETLTPGQTRSIDLARYFRDPDGDALTYTSSSSDTATATTTVTGSRLTVQGVAQGSAIITVTATDDPGGLSIRQSFTVTVARANRPPETRGPIPDRTVTVHQSFTVNAAQYFSDPDGDSLTYAVSSTAAATVFAARDGNVVTVTGLLPGSAIITVTATDPGRLSVSLSFTVTVARANRPPQTRGSIPGGTVTVGQSFTVNAAQYFSDPDGDPLAYAASSSDTTTATVAVSGSTVTVRGVAVGRATLAVTATDPGSLSAEQRFDVTVGAADDHSCARGQETVLAVGDSVGGVLTAGDEDCFAVRVASGPGGLRIAAYTEGGTDTRGALYDANYGQLAANDDDGEGTNFLISRAVTTAGTYYVNVRGFNNVTAGPYVLKVDDRGGSRATATVVAVGDSVAGRLGTQGNLDYFRVDVASSSTLHVSTSGPTDTYGRLFDASGSLLAANDDNTDSNFLISQAVSAGTYYVEVSGFASISTGPYVLRAGEPSARDDHSCVQGQETPLAWADSVAGELTAGDEDCFAVIIPASATGGRLTAWSTGATDTYATLYNSAYDTVDYNDDGLVRPTLNFLVVDTLAAPGTYYVRVRGFDPATTGSYVIHADDHGNSMDYATDHWTIIRGDSIVNAGAIAVPDNRDFFVFSLDTTVTVSMGTTGTTDTYGTLFASDGSVIAGNDDDGPGNNFLIEQRLDPGDYFVEVRGFSRLTTGSYVLSAWASSGGGSSIMRLTNDSAEDQSPTWSSDGSRIAFASNRDGNYEIHVMNANGTGVANLTNNSASDFAPAWSPDGSRIAFESDRNGNSDIYVMNADGTGVTRLTTNSAADNHPTWSADGSRIAFWSLRGGTGDTYVMNADGSGVAQLATHAIRPAWSPSRTRGRIAFVSIRNAPNNEIHVMNEDGTDVANLTNHSAYDDYPAWSPDGARIAFISSRATGNNIFVMGADGTNVTQLTDYAGSSGPAWSPDGASIAFASSHSGNNNEIYVVTAPRPGSTPPSQLGLLRQTWRQPVPKTRPRRR